MRWRLLHQLGRLGNPRVQARVDAGLPGYLYRGMQARHKVRQIQLLLQLQHTPARREQGPGHYQGLLQDGHVVGPHELEEIAAQLVLGNGRQGGVAGDRGAGDLERDMDDAQGHDAHLVGVLAVVGVEKAHEHAEELPDGGEGVRAQVD